MRKKAAWSCLGVRFSTVPRRFLRCFGVSTLDELPPLPQKEEDGMVETTLEEVIEEADGEPPSDG